MILSYKLWRCDSYLHNLKTLLTAWLGKVLGIASEDGWHEFENLFSSPSSSSPRNLVSAPESEQSPLKVNLSKARSQQSSWEHPHTPTSKSKILLVPEISSSWPIADSQILIFNPDSNVLVWILNYLSILCVSNILVWNHLCEGGRRQQKQRLVTSQLTSLKPDTWVDQLLSGQETDNLGGSLPV